MEQNKRFSLSDKIKKLGNKLFAKFFGFEVGIDITDDVAVLHRRNIVIKNIIFISNLFYSALLLILSISTKQQTDWVITVISFPLTFLINKLLKKLISIDHKDKTKQLIATYVASFYIFLSSVVIYAKLYNTGSFETVSYILIYYALVVISLYQDKKLLSSSFVYLFVLVTMIHLIWTYNILNITNGLSAMEFLKQFVGTTEFGDLILRSLVFSLFYLVLYVIVSIGQYMQDERKKELVKRRQVQNDFSSIVGNLFEAVFINAYVLVNADYAKQVQTISEKIANFIGMNSADIKNLSNFSIVHLRYEEISNISLQTESYDDKTYEAIKSKTQLGSDIVRRIDLSQNSEDIVRAYLEDVMTPEKMTAIINKKADLESQIILLADIYLTLRSPKSYKRPFTHKTAVSLIDTKMGPFFDQNLRERFNKFSSELEEIYNNFQ